MAKHIDRIERLFEKSPVVDFKSIERLAGNYAKLLVHNMLKQGRIKKLGKGVYTRHDEASLTVFAFNPAYLGLQSALSHHGLWEQETIPVILTGKKARRGIRKVMGSNVLIRHLDKKYLFGFELCQEQGFYLPYSDVEKTFIDMIVFNQNIDPDVLKSMRRRMSKRRLGEYLKRYPKNIRERIAKV